MEDADAPYGELPDELADLAAEGLLGSSGADHSQRLEELCAAHPRHEAGLRQFARRLVAADRLLDETYPGGPSPAAPHLPGYRVRRKLGEGAFGVVWLCEQRQPVVREVAIKVLRPGAGDENTLRRFAAERQLLAKLNHAAVTQVFDAGALADGRPYFVMEYVAGSTFRRYCEERALSCRDRLRLFLQVCGGVAHAHARGIVHRDLKPANVLVVDTEAGPLPKVIDFGIAKALHAAVDSDDGPRTDTGRVIGTPGYMSPEQAAGSGGDLDERADVFALGVMLYEVMTGELPWPRGAATTTEDPVRPSARVTQSTTASAALPVTSRRPLAAELRGEIDWITLRALARERDERYPSVTALIDDLQRHLRGEPVTAGPPSVGYRARKFVRRNRVAVAFTAVLAVLAAALAVTVVWGTTAEVIASAAVASAEASTASVQAAVDTLIGRANDPRVREGPGGDETRRALLVDALALAERIRRERPTDPAVRAQHCKALYSIAHVHWLVGDAPRTVEFASEAVAEAEDLLADRPDSSARQGLLGESLRWQAAGLSLGGREADAHSLLARAVEHLGAAAAADLRTHGRSHAAALREAAEALPLSRGEERLAGSAASVRVLEALAAECPDLSGVPEDLVLARTRNAQQLLVMGRADQAMALVDRAEAELSKVTRDRAMLTYLLAEQRMMAASAKDDRDQAAELAQRCVERASLWLEEQPGRYLPRTKLAAALALLGNEQNYRDRFVESSLAFRRSIEQLETLVEQSAGAARYRTLLCNSLVQYVRALTDRFRRSELDEASVCIERAIAVAESVPADVRPTLPPLWHLLSLQALIEGARGQAANWAGVAAQLPGEVVASNTFQKDALAGALTGVAAHWFEAGRLEEAAAWVARARALIEAHPPIAKRMVEVGWLEARLACRNGDHAAAAAAADRVFAARPTWFGRKRAADCLHAAWRCATATKGAEAASVDYARRATMLYGQVTKTLQKDLERSPHDPYWVLPWAFASIRAAELAAAAGDSGAARDALAECLPRLEAVRAEAHANEWDAAAVADGTALQRRLAENR